MTNTQHRQPVRPWRWALLAIALVAGLVLLVGCGKSVDPLNAEQLQQLEQNMRAIEASPETLLTSAEGEVMVPATRRVAPDGSITLTPRFTTLSGDLVLTALADQYGKEADQATDPAAKARARFLQGYTNEYIATSRNRPELYKDAYGRYREVQGSGTAYAVQGAWRAGILADEGKAGLGPNEAVESAKTSYAVVRDATGAPSVLQSRQPNQGAIVTRNPELAGQGGNLPATADATQPGQPTLTVMTDTQAIHTMALHRLDDLYRVSTGWDYYYWHSMNFVVGLFQPARIGQSAAVVLSLLFIALFVKVITIPLTNASYRGMRDMQRIQPLLKEVQAKYKDDKAKQLEEQQRIMKEHKVNMTGGCLPMLVQLPIFILIFVAIQKYAFAFAYAGFLWIGSLANPDLILLGLYLVSMFITQKLTATPTTDPQQELMQKQMTYLMPVMLAVMLSNVAAAFILYWFFLNVFTFVHQYWYMRKMKAEAPMPAADAPVPDVRQPVKKTPEPRSTGTSSKDKKGK